MIVTEEKVNLTRQKEFDIMKVLSIIFMIIIHVYEELSLYNRDCLCDNAYDTIIQFLGGIFAAPVFMFAMGIGMAYSKHRTPKDFILRGVKLLIFSYLYNVIRFTIPNFIHCLRTEMDIPYLIYDTFHADILTFAGLAFILTGVLKKVKVPVIGVFGIAIAMQAIALFVANTFEIENPVLIYILAPFINSGEPSYFPLFLWYIYPSLGLLYAKYLRHIENTDKLYGCILLISSLMIIAFSITLSYIGYDIRYLFAIYEDVFYDQTFLHVVFSILCILFEASIIHFILKVVHIQWLEKGITYLSSNLNNIYIVQWIIIGWLSYMVFYDGNEFPTGFVIPVGIVIMAISCGIVLLFQKITKKNNII